MQKATAALQSALDLRHEKEERRYAPANRRRSRLDAQRTGADGLDAEGIPEYFNAAFIERLRQLGCREFHVWTIDDPQVADFYAKLGAASITTNRPGWLRKEMAKGGGE